jgi:hypothetical protein
MPWPQSGRMQYEETNKQNHLFNLGKYVSLTTKKKNPLPKSISIVTRFGFLAILSINKSNRHGIPTVVEKGVFEKRENDGINSSC